MGEVFVEILSLDGMHNALNGQLACMVTFVLDTAQMDLTPLPEGVPGVE